MTFSSKLTAKNQTTLPAAVVKALHIQPSSVLAYEVLEGGAVMLTAKSTTFADHLRSFPKKKPATKVSVETMKKAVATGAARRFKKADS